LCPAVPCVPLGLRSSSPCHSPLATRHSPLASRHQPLTTDYCLLNTDYRSPITDHSFEVSVCSCSVLRHAEAQNTGVQLRVPADEYHVHGPQSARSLDAPQTLCLRNITNPSGVSSSHSCHSSGFSSCAIPARNHISATICRRHRLLTPDYCLLITGHRSPPADYCSLITDHSATGHPPLATRHSKNLPGAA